MCVPGPQTHSLSESVLPEHDTPTSPRPVPQEQPAAGTAFSARQNCVSGWPRLRQENYRSRRGSLKLLTHDLPVLTYAKGHLKRFNPSGVREHLNVGTTLLERQAESMCAHRFALCSPDRPSGDPEQTAHSVQGKVGQEVKGHEKADIGGNNDISNNGILKTL